MARSRPRTGGLRGALATTVVAAFGLGPAAAAAGAVTYSVVTPIDISSACSGQNAEVEAAADPKLGYVYELWMGCNGIGFARSTDGGYSFGAPLVMPSSNPASKSWDPAIAVGSNGNVYASYMVSSGNQYYPVVATSTNHGASFTQVAYLTPPSPKNWGDRDFIAVGPDGTVYVTWDYAPSRSSIVYNCPSGGSCTFAAGQFNIVIQKSTDGGRSFEPMVHVTPGYPSGGADSGPLVVEPSGRIDVLYQGYSVTGPNYPLGPGYSYFTASTDGGASWSPPVGVGQGAGTMSPAEWWIDGDIARDSAGTLYATWDTQGTNSDFAWLSYSTNGGTKWSTPTQAPADSANVPHIIQVTGAGSGTAYVGWLSDSNPLGYAQYLRTFKVGSGWSSAPVTVSSPGQYGNPGVWPGDTFGITTTSATQVVLSWGSAVSSSFSSIFAAPVSVTP